MKNKIIEREKVIMEKDSLNTHYFINAVSVERTDSGALRCKINERALIPIFNKYFKRKYV